ncbi:MAG TPA: oligosaccharide flippase family protein [Xanthobacteraceae bacterium]|jgi:O-antigen/teichoic acid export membrane protein|nr:oligosaccharide flippase family protein [Xanthobacteraceae bacterium]HQS46094.1 oligosaccharide flippase family protein [Xanthobacteraceae bacterium]
MTFRTRFSLQRLPAGVRESLYYASGIIMVRAIGLILLPVNTRFLSADDYGHLEVLLAFADVGSQLFALALPTALSRFVGAAAGWDERRRVCAEMFGVALLTALVFGAAGLAFATPLASVLPGTPTTWEVRMLLIALCTEGLLAVGLTWLRIRGQAGTFLALSLGRTVLFALLSISLLFAGFGVIGILIATAASAGAQTLAMVWLVVKDTGIRLRGINWPGLALYVVPLLLSGIAAFALGTFDRWILADAVDPAALGLYGVAVRIGVLTAVLLQPFHMWWMPKRFIVLEEPEGAARSARMVGVGILITLLAAAGVALAGPLVITLMTPPAFHAAAIYVPWLALIYVVQESTSLVAVGCFLRKDGFAPLAINLVAAGVVIALYFVFIPRYGVAGAIGATLAAQVLRFALTLAISYHYARIAYPFGRLALVALFLLAAVGAADAWGEPLALFLLAGPVLALGALLTLVLGLVPAVSERWPLLRRFSPLGGR